MKSALDTIRKTAAEMIEGIDAKLKVLLAEKAQSAEKAAEAPVKETVPEEKPEVPIYRETANYAYEADELESYRASLAANVECRKAIEAAISSNYGCLLYTSPKKPQLYDAVMRLDDSGGKYVSFKMEFDR